MVQVCVCVSEKQELDLWTSPLGPPCSAKCRTHTGTNRQTRRNCHPSGEKRWWVQGPGSFEKEGRKSRPNATVNTHTPACTHRNTSSGSCTHTHTHSSALSSKSNKQFEQGGQVLHGFTAPSVLKRLLKGAQYGTGFGYKSL